MAILHYDTPSKKLQLTPRQKLIDAASEMYQLAHHAAADGRKMGLGIEKERLYAADDAVDVGLLALVFKVADAPHALDDEAGRLLPRKVDGEAGICLDLNTRLAGIQRRYGRHALLRRIHAALGLIDTHSDNNPVEKGKGTPDDRVVTDGERVEAARENSCSIHD